MKRIPTSLPWPQLLLCFFLCCQALAARATPPPEIEHGGFRVVIDPGHGGTDTGASYGPFRESVMVLDYARLLKNRLAKDPLFSPQLTRNSDENLSLQERVRRAENHQGELFVSLHMNASVDPRAKGALFFIQDHVGGPGTGSKRKAAGNDIGAILSDLSEHSRRLLSLGYVKLLYTDWSEDIGIKKTATNSPVRQAPFYVVTKNKMPSVLVELGFLSNRKEATVLSQESHQQKVIGVIHDSLTKYREHFRKKATSVRSFE